MTSCAMSAAGARYVADHDALCQVARRAADDAARFRLPLSGRGTRPDRSRSCLRGPAGSLRHPVLAGIQGPRRLPHADGLGRSVAQGGFSTASPGCRCRASTSCAPSAVQQGDQNSVLNHYRRFLAFRKQHPAFAKGEIEFRAYEGDGARSSRADTATRRCCAFST